MRAGFVPSRRAYFFSSGFDSLTEEGVLGDGVAEEPAAEEPVPPAELDAAAPVPPGVVVVASAFGASAGAGVGAGVGAVVVAGGLGVAGGVTVLVSSFLQAVRPTATRAAMRSERFIVFLWIRGGGHVISRSGRHGYRLSLSDIRAS